jgi:hypothetical protein
MIKSAVIFSDEDQNKKEEKNFHSAHKEKVSLSRDEYRQLINDAYHEGREDALKEHSEKEIKSQKKTTVELKGKEEAIRTHAKEKEENKQRFKTITARQDIEILRAKGVFPFNLFPDTLVIDTTKVTLVRKQLFATEYIATIPLKDLSDVNVQTVLFLGTLMIRYMPQSNTPGMNEPVNIKIPNLHRYDAIRAKNILKGALVAKAEEIDIAKLSPDEVVDVLEKFGHSEGVL